MVRPKGPIRVVHLITRVLRQLVPGAGHHRVVVVPIATAAPVQQKGDVNVRQVDDAALVVLRGSVHQHLQVRPRHNLPRQQLNGRPQKANLNQLGAVVRVQRGVKDDGNLVADHVEGAVKEKAHLVPPGQRRAGVGRGAEDLLKGEIDLLEDRLPAGAVRVDQTAHLAADVVVELQRGHTALNGHPLKGGAHVDEAGAPGAGAGLLLRPQQYAAQVNLPRVEHRLGKVAQRDQNLAQSEDNLPAPDGGEAQVLGVGAGLVDRPQNGHHLLVGVVGGVGGEVQRQLLRLRREKGRPGGPRRRPRFIESLRALHVRVRRLPVKGGAQLGDLRLGECTKRLLDVLLNLLAGNGPPQLALLVLVLHEDVIVGEAHLKGVVAHLDENVADLEDKVGRHGGAAAAGRLLLQVPRQSALFGVGEAQPLDDGHELLVEVVGKVKLVGKVEGDLVDGHLDGAVALLLHQLEDLPVDGVLRLGQVANE